MATELTELLSRGILSPIDVQLALTLADLDPQSDVEVRLGIALVSWALNHGHCYADLPALTQRRWSDDKGQPVAVALPEPQRWLSSLAKSSLVQTTALESRPKRPLVLDSGRLYLARYYDYEIRLARRLLELAVDDQPAGTPEQLGQALQKAFSGSSPGDDEQRAAAVVALLRRLAIVSGGPGTGKTFTVARLLSVLQQQALDAGRPPHRIALLAPTGKAAQRLGESIGHALAAVELSAEVAASIPRSATTVHRALGYDPGRPQRLRYHRDHPLGVDLVVLDEASMVDLALLTKLLDALPPHARLLLLGDSHQLGPVEVGMVFSGLFTDVSRGYSPALANRAQAATGVELPRHGTDCRDPLADSRVELRRSHRFGVESGISALAQAVRGGDVGAALGVLGAARDVELILVNDPSSLGRALEPLLLEYLGDIGRGNAEDKLRLLDGFRVLCCHRQGHRGVKSVNLLAEDLLREHGRIDAHQPSYAGRPVIVTRNDYDVELFNGDVGVFSPLPQAVARDGPALGVYFQSNEPGRLRLVNPGQLPEHETLFAVSVHKAQGSEFDHVVLVLPELPSFILTRELVYTAVTRARRRVTILGSEEMLGHALSTRIERASSLGQRLEQLSSPGRKPLAADDGDQHGA